MPRVGAGTDHDAGAAADRRHLGAQRRRLHREFGPAGQPERSKTLAEGIQWGDYTFHAGSDVRLRHDFEVYELAYECAFVHQSTHQVAAGLDGHDTDNRVQLSGDATVTDSGGNTTPAFGTTRASSLPAPLHMFGIRVSWAVAPRWIVQAQGQSFRLSSDDYKGFWSDLRASATWMFSRHFGIGPGYDPFRMSGDASADASDGRLSTGRPGLQACLTGSC